jgi:hypothetical protein
VKIPTSTLQNPSTKSFWEQMEREYAEREAKRRARLTVAELEAEGETEAVDWLTDILHAHLDGIETWFRTSWRDLERRSVPTDPAELAEFEAAVARVAQRIFRPDGIGTHVHHLVRVLVTQAWRPRAPKALS